MSLSNTTLCQCRCSSWFLVGITVWLWSTPVLSEVSTITTIVGNGTAGYSGDGSSAVTAQLSTPIAAELDSSSNLYIIDSGNNRIRKVNTITGNINTVAGNGTAGYSGDSGSAVSAQLNFPYEAVIDSSGNLYIADTSNHRIRKVDAFTSKISTVAGNGTDGYNGDGIAATSASLYRPMGITLDSHGNLYITDRSSHRIRKVDAITGKISTVAGNGTGGYNGDSRAATSATLNYPTNIALDSNGNLYIADSANFRVRKVDAMTGNISTVAGNGTNGYNGDGIVATSAQVNPSDIVLDNDGNLYIVSGYRVRKVDAITGNISTVVGNGTAGYSGDGGLATNASIYAANITLDSSQHNLYIADFGNHRIRRVELTQGLSQPSLTIDPMLMPLNKSTSQTLAFTVSNAANAAASVALGAPILSGYYADQFAITTTASNDCANTTLAAGDSCAISVHYTPNPNQSLPDTTVVLGIPSTGGVVRTQALISSSESASGQAARRLPDVLTSINVPSLTVGNSATISWTMTGYQTDAHSQIALFECATDGTGNVVSTCGNSYDSRTVASEVLAPTTTADGDWTYQNVRAKNRTYSYVYTPTKTGPVVLRFYQKSGIDKDAGNSGTSLLIPGGLNGSGSSFTYFDAEGRRIKATVQ